MDERDNVVGHESKYNCKNAFAFVMSLVLKLINSIQVGGLGFVCNLG